MTTIKQTQRKLDKRADALRENLRKRKALKKAKKSEETTKQNKETWNHDPARP